MSDFIFSSSPRPHGELSRSLSIIYVNYSVGSQEFHGAWGSLGVTSSRYYGYQPLETERYICVVLGGPVLYFQKDDFIGGDDPQAATRCILEHWRTGKVDWSEDLSGPFVVLIIDKKNSIIECITDMLMFIPVYQYCDGDSITLGTHVDALAKACGDHLAFDEASLIDFILHHAVTYPYTAYENILQCQPGSVHRWGRVAEKLPGDSFEVESYWQPVEDNPYANLDELAAYLRNGVEGYIERITTPLQKVAQFISAGEDSRALSGLLPQRIQRDAYIFLDHMNREGRIAQKVAGAYGAHFNPSYRSETHYLEILPQASDLVGSGHQYTHAHTLGFEITDALGSYRAVFGGYISDSLLKANYARKPKWLKRFSFLPEFSLNGEDRTTRVSSEHVSPEILDEITRRRQDHFARVKSIRPNSAHEWFELWPATMRITIPNLYSNRRLFASYEIFMAKESVKAAAAAPVNWKLNRRLFLKAFKPALKKSRFILHADGYFPYYPWWINLLIQPPIWIYWKVPQYLRIQKNQGPWGEWRKAVRSSLWKDCVSTYTHLNYPAAIKDFLASGGMENSKLPIKSKVNLLQICYQINAHQERNEQLSNEFCSHGAH